VSLKCTPSGSCNLFVSEVLPLFLIMGVA
jgi:hypothetical protein